MQTKNAINKIVKKGYTITEEKGLYTFVIDGRYYSFRDQFGSAILFQTHFEGAIHPEFFSNLTQLIRFAETDYSKTEETEKEVEAEELDTFTPKANKSSFGKWLETMIDEKGVDIDSEIIIDGHFGITHRSLVEFLETVPKEHKKIKNTLVAIDFKNGDIFHYIKHLAECMISYVYGK